MTWSQNLLLLACGLIALQSSLAAQGVIRSCSYGGLFHVEQNGRYSLTYSTAEKLCMSIGTTLATKEQVQRAFDLGFQTCRYGWIQNHSIVILRQEPYTLCAANKTGIIIISDMISQPYDAYCFNVSDTKDKNCEFSIVPSNTFETFLDAHVDNESTTEFTPASPRPEGEPAALPTITETTQKTTAAIVPPVHMGEDEVSHTGQHDDSTTESMVIEQDSGTGTVSTTTSAAIVPLVHMGEDEVSHMGQHDVSTTESIVIEQDSGTDIASTTTSAAIVPPVHVDEYNVDTGPQDKLITQSPTSSTSEPLAGEDSWQDINKDPETGTVSTTTSAVIAPTVQVDEDKVSHTGQHFDSTTESTVIEQHSETGIVSTTTSAAIVPPAHVNKDKVSHTGQHDDSTTESPNVEEDSETGTVSTTTSAAIVPPVHMGEDEVSHTGQHDYSTTESMVIEQHSETGTVSTTTSAAIVPPAHVNKDMVSHTGQHDDSTTESPNVEEDSETGTVSTTTSAAIVPPVHMGGDEVSHTGKHDDSTTESPNTEQDSETGTVSTTTSAAIVPPVNVAKDKATPIEPTAGDTTANDVQEGDDAGPEVTTQSHHSSTFHISAGEDTSQYGNNDKMIRSGGLGLMTSAPPAKQASRVAPDWLVIVAVVAASLIIVLVCAVISSKKRWCGKKKTLVINGNAGEKGGKEQEMVQLMNKEKIRQNGAASEEFTIITLEEPAEKRS
ncbi:CD44 antigen-like [Polyodon spathula]|uniref:CD44 antigen-like n=1 Tax=Polyodon spathula TaxID=7913 RepID=UPI001B7EECBE|nr:CD44 antigen-like [Polyodon spathula]